MNKRLLEVAFLALILCLAFAQSSATEVKESFCESTVTVEMYCHNELYDPIHPRTYLTKAWHAYYDGHYFEAEEWLDAHMDNYRLTAEVAVLYGHLYQEYYEHRLGIDRKNNLLLLRQAGFFYREAIKLDQNRIEAYLELANVMEKAGQRERKIFKVLKTAYDRFENEGFYLDTELISRLYGSLGAYYDAFGNCCEAQRLIILSYLFDPGITSRSEVNHIRRKCKCR